jgi:energy-coupling factor transporter ATP-binding protein EcfA2
MTNYYYSAYGLNFASSFPLPELMSVDKNEPDVIINYGKAPKKLESSASHGKLWQSEPGKLLLSVETVARFLILDNKEIIIDPVPESSGEDIRVFLLGSVLAALLYLRNIPIIHASVIETPKGAVLFMGTSGAGKSTLLTAFLQRGYGMLTDDKAAIILEDNSVKVLSAFPTARIMEKTIKELNFPTENSWMGRGMGKYIVPVKNFIRTPSKIYAAYSLQPHNKEEIVLEKLGALEKFHCLNKNTYRRRFMNQPGQTKEHLRILGKISEQSRVIKVLRPKNSKLIGKLADRIEEDFTN